MAGRVDAGDALAVRALRRGRRQDLRVRGRPAPPGGRLGAVKGGTLYPVLARLELDGLLVSSWREGAGGPGRKFFAVTPAGESALTERVAGWTTFTDRAAALLAT